jgi:hypothetical protein
MHKTETIHRLYKFLSEDDILTQEDEYLNFDENNKKVTYSKIPKCFYGTKVHRKEAKARYFRREVNDQMENH